MEFMSGRIKTTKSPLRVYAYCSPNGTWGLYSNDNRRLAVLLMYQACNRRQMERCDVWRMLICCLIRDACSAFSDLAVRTNP